MEKKMFDNEFQNNKSMTLALGLIALFILLCIIAFPFQFFWNNVLIESVTFARNITYWQAVGILFLIHLATATSSLRRDKK